MFKISSPLMKIAIIYSLRGNDVKLSLLKPKTNFLKRSFSKRAAQRWNELLHDITTNIEDSQLPGLFLKHTTLSFV